MTKPIKTVLYIVGIALFVAVPVIIRQANPDIAKPPSVALPPGLPDASSRGLDTPPGFPADTVSGVPRGNIRNPAPGAFVPPGQGEGPPEAVRLRAAQDQVPADEIVYGFVRRLLAKDAGAAVSHAEGMLVSDDVRMRAMGVVTPAALWAAGWLHDHDQGAVAEELIARQRLLALGEVLESHEDPALVFDGAPPGVKLP
jgi:hypothetical protein